jgi:hypothetical protein
LRFLLQTGHGLQRQLLQRPRDVRQMLHGRRRLREVLPQVVSTKKSKKRRMDFSVRRFSSAAIASRQLRTAAVNGIFRACPASPNIHRSCCSCG